MDVMEAINERYSARDFKPDRYLRKPWIRYWRQLYEALPLVTASHGKFLCPGELLQKR